MPKPANLPPKTVSSFDETFDVVVVGFGYAGGVSAITAHDAGAKVLLIEKMSTPGGISICAGGGIRMSRDRDGLISYLEATNDGRTPRDVHETFVDEMLQVEDFVRDLAKVNGGEIGRVDRPANYPFPGHDAMYFIEVLDIPGFDGAREYPSARSISNGAKLFKVLDDSIRERGIETRLSTSAMRLIADGGGVVQGLWVDGPDGRKAIKARRGVVLACGGFEAGYEMQRQYWQYAPTISASFRGNTGDGIRMALDVGADLWHMWHYHGSYGFKHPDPDYPFSIRVKKLPDWVSDIREPDVEMAWILVDKTGKRFMNEYPPYLQDTGHRPLDNYDTVQLDYPYVPCHMIVDEDGRKMYPLGSTIFNDADIEPYFWSQDNMKEVQNGILRKADSIAELAGLIGCEADALQASVDRWNAACEAGEDAEHARAPKTMMPIKSPPFYTGEMWPVVSNTQGGPVHDANYRVLNPFGEPIPNLYEAGECGGIWGFLYIGGANLTECFVGGRIAGREAAAQKAWD
ncbi:MAG: FAD-dependent oxidoreductase [Alphaproteobacteria bacterium]|nr:FAD-dependent oxidoreductase [Alphaproteobacteria bacterium]